ncbi:MAG: hypothetical protein AB1486_15495 [Planctomycetota bacterium]
MLKSLGFTLLVVATLPQPSDDGGGDELQELRRQNQALNEALVKSEATGVALQRRVAELEATLEVQTRALRKSAEALAEKLSVAEETIRELEAQRGEERQAWIGRYQDVEASRLEAERRVEQQRHADQERLRERDARIAQLEAALERASVNEARVQDLERLLSERDQSAAQAGESLRAVQRELEQALARERIGSAREAAAQEELRRALTLQGERNWEGLAAALAARDTEIGRLKADLDRLQSVLDRLLSSSPGSRGESSEERSRLLEAVDRLQRELEALRRARDTGEDTGGGKVPAGAGEVPQPPQSRSPAAGRRKA